MFRLDSLVSMVSGLPDQGMLKLTGACACCAPILNPNNISVHF
jgi:hypothetical protein